MNERRFTWQDALPDKTDSELIQRYQENGDSTLIAILFHRYIDMLYGLSMKYMKEPVEAEDTTYEVFEILLDKLKKHDVDNFKSWLYRMTSNYCIDKIRKAKKMQVIDIGNLSIIGTESQYNLATDEKEQLLIKIENCLQNLVDDQKYCIEMFYFKEKSYQEISENLEISWSKTRSNIQNGKRNIKICMEGK